MAIEVSFVLMVARAGLGLGPLDGVGVLVVGLGHIVGVESFGLIRPPQKLFVTSTDSVSSLEKVKSSIGDPTHKPIKWLKGL